MSYREQETFNIQQYFNNLNLENWSASGNLVKGGQAHVIEVKNLQTKEIGVFRALKRQGKKDIDRFEREIRILANFSHPNIMKILDQTTEKQQPWYISKKGEQFETYWEKIKEELEETPDALLEKAVEMIQCLTDGLVPLHDCGVIHRDIKARNVVVIDGKPVLIDFGVAFVTGEERLTPSDEAVANKLSPDLSLYFSESVPPWIDVFLLSQFLIWMVAKKTNKPHVQRPLDWRWVVYHPDLSTNGALKVKAFTSICSNYVTSPKSAKELKTLLQNLFSMDISKSSEDREDLKNLLKEIETGTARQISHFTNSFELIESRLPLARMIFEQLLCKLHDLQENMPNPIKIKQSELSDTSSFLSELKTENYTLQGSYQSMRGFHVEAGLFSMSFSLVLQVYTKKHLDSISSHFYLEDLPHIELRLLQDQHARLAEAGMTKTFYLIPGEDGSISLCRNTATKEELRKITIEDVIDMIYKSIVDAEVWKVLSR